MDIKKGVKGKLVFKNYRERIRLRLRHAGERYSLNLPFACLPENMYHGAIKAAEIKLDIAKGRFDPTLEKYNPTPLVLPQPNFEGD